jgi:hypothetical protein
LREIREIVST